MPYPLQDSLVVGVSASALLDLRESETMLAEHGETHLRTFEEQHLDEPLRPGPGFEVIRRLLSLNALSSIARPLVEVIVVSRAAPETGLRVLRSARSHGLHLNRAVFTQGASPYGYFESLGLSLFLTQNLDDLAGASRLGLLAGQIMGTSATSGEGVRIAFDIDTVLGAQASQNGHSRPPVPNAAPRLARFLERVARIQTAQARRPEEDGERRLQISVLTAREAPAYERALHTLQAWGLQVDEAFFLAGMDTSGVLETMQPDLLVAGSGPASDLPGVRIPLAVEGHEAPMPQRSYPPVFSAWQQTPQAEPTESLDRANLERANLDSLRRPAFEPVGASTGPVGLSPNARTTSTGPIPLAVPASEPPQPAPQVQAPASDIQTRPEPEAPSSTAHEESTPPPPSAPYDPEEQFIWRQSRPPEPFGRSAMEYEEQEEPTLPESEPTTATTSLPLEQTRRSRHGREDYPPEEYRQEG